MAARQKGAGGRLLDNIRTVEFRRLVLKAHPEYPKKGTDALTKLKKEHHDEYVRLAEKATEYAKAQSGNAVVQPPEEGETQETQRYWQQYISTRQDPEYKAEQEQKKRDVVAPLRGEYDPKKHSPADPSDPNAYVPAYVRFAKRKLVNFTCPITGWRETDWIQPINGGKIRLVGELTLDHKLARSRNGRTTDENTRMICGLANGKKGDRQKFDNEIRMNIVSNWRVVEPPQELLSALTKFGVREYRIL